MTDLDLTPFGFTPTENIVYLALLRRGPSGAYPLARDVGVARANVYQALSGLANKGAAVLLGEDPKEYRAVQPELLYATIVESESAQLENLARQLEEEDSPGEPGTVPVSSDRAAIRLVTRDGARSADPITLIVTPERGRDLAPLLRKRDVEGQESRLYLVGQADVELPVPLAGTLSLDDVAVIGAAPFLFLGSASALAGNENESGFRGFWTSEPLKRALISAAAAHITG